MVDNIYVYKFNCRSKKVENIIFSSRRQITYPLSELEDNKPVDAVIANKVRNLSFVGPNYARALFLCYSVRVLKFSQKMIQLKFG